MTNGYLQFPATPALVTNTTPPISLCLAVNNFVVDYVGEEHFKPLIKVLEQKYTISIN
jgi:hypothetical protein